MDLADFFAPGRSLVVSGTWPTPEEIAQARAAGFGHEMPFQSQFGDDDTLAAALVANRSPVAGLGFDPGRATRVKNLADMYGIAGRYEPKPDWMYYDNKAPSALVHESIHRGSKRIRDTGPPTNDVAAVSTSPRLEELFVRDIMNRTADGRETSEAERLVREGDIDNAGGGLDQIASASRLFGGSRHNTAISENVQRLAAEMIMRQRPYGGPR